MSVYTQLAINCIENTMCVYITQSALFVFIQHSYYTNSQAHTHIKSHLAGYDIVHLMPTILELLRRLYDSLTSVIGKCTAQPLEWHFIVHLH